MAAKHSEKFQQAFTLHKENKLDEAECLYTEILEEEPENAEVWNLLGMINLRKFNLGKAEKFINKAISITPSVYFYESLAKVYLEMEDAQKAIVIYNELVKYKPDSYDYVFNLASAYKISGDMDKSIETYKRAIELKSDDYMPYFNLGLIYTNLSNPQEAVKYYKKAIELNPDDMETRYFTGLAYFRNRDYRHGLPYFESRLCRQTAIVTHSATYPNLMNTAPVWSGEDIVDKTVYTYYEAGFGDVIMFVRYLPLLKQRCKHIIFKPQLPLAELFEENFPDIEVMKLFKHETQLHFDYHIPLLSLPYALGLDESNMFISKSGYLKALDEKIERYKNKYFNNDKFKIGIKWRGNTHYEMDRVIDIKSFVRLFGIKNTKFYSFQTFEGSEDLNDIINDYDIVDIGRTVENFSDTAGALANLDMVICNDTSLAHLAGAMGKSCWVLLPYLYNWRWHLDLTKCDWYDTVKLYRQKETGNWDEIFERMYVDLSKIVK
ncbi:MAG: tetratricopeptide repeat protein [Candidatus Gastranaerophilales bacterium]|nr:tetratricopeptide repeat protein [Candidatus Gastranaerophilales bacterium]